MVEDATGPPPWWVPVVDVIRPILARWWPTMVAVAFAAASPVAYIVWADGALSRAVLLSSLSVYLMMVAVAIQLRPFMRYVTRRRRWEALGGRAFSGAVAYIPIGYVVLWILDLSAEREFPLLEVSALRYVLIWPFYLWFVVFCPMDGMPCPTAPTG